MTRPFDVLVVGELNVDLIAQGDVTPEYGQVEKLIDDLSICAGSSSAIFAASAAKMGLRVLFASRVGDDLFGRFMVQALEDAGVDPSHVTIDPEIKTGATIMLSRGDDRAALTYLGAIAAVSSQDILPEYYQQARHLHVASPFLLTGLRSAMPDMMYKAKRSGMTVSLDTNWDPAGRWALGGFFEPLDVLLPNEAELLALTGTHELDSAIDVMRQRVPVVAIKRGARGAAAVTPDERFDVPALPVHVVDATGAGDTFDGGFLAGWLGGEPLDRCLALGAVCGALTTTQMGGFNGQPIWDEACALVDRIEKRGAGAEGPLPRG